jgi:diguanylate cyclase (GGDEF)-like protein
MTRGWRSLEARPGGTAADAVIARARWAGVALAVLQVTLYRPSPGVEMPYPVVWVLVPAVLMAAVNVAVGPFARTSAAARVAPHTWWVVGLLGDAVAILLLNVGFAYDPASALWTLLLLPPIEAAMRGWSGAALAAWAASSATYVALLAASHEWGGTPLLAADSLTYRLGLLGIVSFAAAGQSRRLNAQIARSRASQAEADQLRAVAAATRTMTSLDVPTIIREVARAAELLGFADPQLWSRGGRLGVAVPGVRGPHHVPTSVGQLDQGATAAASSAGVPAPTVLHAPTATPVATGPHVATEPHAPHLPPVPAGDLSGVRFDDAAAATAGRGWTTIADASTPGEVLVVAPVRTGGSVETLLAGRLPAPVDERAAEGLVLLAGQAAAALANALRHEESRAFEERLAHQATHDHLTGLPNRVLLGERGRQCLARERRRGSMVALLLIDLDAFGQVNDAHGNATGDALLREVGARLAGLVRPEDVCARVGGDQFAVMSGSHAGVLTVLAQAYRLRSALHQPFRANDTTLDVEVSLGIAWAPDDGEDVDTLLQRADVALGHAKRSRTGVALYRDAADHEETSQVAVLGDLRRALDSGTQLEVHFQPIVPLAGAEHTGLEALVRWHHPTRGDVPPSDFIKVAESTSVIHQLTDVVMETALRSLAGWLSDGLDLRVAVNLSPRALVDVSLPQRVEALLAAYDVPPDRLCLEITEDTLVDDPTRAIATMHRLKETGVRLSIDDFGTGYSSMSYLKSLPADEIKIDRTFVTDMLASTRDGSLVRSVVDLAHRLELEVVAEGVEDLATYDALTAAGCDLAQGFFVGRPMPGVEVAGWFARWSARGPGADAESGEADEAGAVGEADVTVEATSVL